MKNNINPVLSIIHSRKSVRHFTGEPVSEEQLLILVRAGMCAPSARNIQPWKFCIITDREIMNSLADGLPYAKMLYKAGGAIAVCGDKKKFLHGDDDELWIQDCSAATQNILLAAESIGLGAVWTAAYPYPDRMNHTITVLKLPGHLIPLNVIPVGVSRGEDFPKDKYKSENIFFNKFKN